MIFSEKQIEAKAHELATRFMIHLQNELRAFSSPTGDESAYLTHLTTAQIFTQGILSATAHNHLPGSPKAIPDMREAVEAVGHDIEKYWFSTEMAEQVAAATRQGLYKPPGLEERKL